MPLNLLSIRPTKEHSSFIKKIEYYLLLTLLIMIGSYFSWSEDIITSRILKTGGRVVGTLLAFHIYQLVKKKGALKKMGLRNHWAIYLYVAYLVLGLISILWSTNKEYSSMQWALDVQSLLFAYFFIASIITLDQYFPDQNISFYTLLGNVSFILLFVFCIGYFVAPELFIRYTHGGVEYRLGGFIMNPNELGMLAGVGISSLFFLLHNKRKRTWTWIKILFMSLALILTASRSSLIGLLLIIIFQVFFFKVKWIKWTIYAAILVLIPYAFQLVILKDGGGIEEILSLTGRIPFWTALLDEAFVQQPWFGFGFMRIHYTDTFQGVHTYAGHMAHNTFLQVLLNLGIVGLSIVVFQMAATFRAIVNVKDRLNRLMFIGILIPILINSFTEFGIFGESNFGILFYQCLVLLICLKPDAQLSSQSAKNILRKELDWRQSESLV